MRGDEVSSASKAKEKSTQYISPSQRIDAHRIFPSFVMLRRCLLADAARASTKKDYSEKPIFSTLEPPLQTGG